VDDPGHVLQTAALQDARKHAVGIALELDRLNINVPEDPSGALRNRGHSHERVARWRSEVASTGPMTTPVARLQYEGSVGLDTALAERSLVALARIAATPAEAFAALGFDQFRHNEHLDLYEEVVLVTSSAASCCRKSTFARGRTRSTSSEPSGAFT
jgi:hypothetical protein